MTFPIHLFPPFHQQRTLDRNEHVKRTPWQIFALRITLILLLLGGGSGFGGWTYVATVQLQTDAFGLMYRGMVDRLAVSLPLALADKKASGTVIADLFSFASTGFMDLPPFEQFYHLANFETVHSRVKSVQFLPYVEAKDRSQFEQLVSMGRLVIACRS